MAMGLIRIVIAGGREFDDFDYMRECMNSIKHLYYNRSIEVISGACRGADELGEQWAAENHFAVESKPPDYKKYPPKQAPLIRNDEMAKRGDVLCAFWDGESRGTRHMIGCAMREGLEIHIFRYGGTK